MLFNCFKYKMFVLKCFFNKIVKFTLANFWIWHQCSLKAGAVRGLQNGETSTAAKGLQEGKGGGGVVSEPRPSS